MKKTITFIFLLFAVKNIAQTPNWLWAKSAGATSDDSGQSIYIDASGNVLITGGFVGNFITFDTTTLTNTNSLYYDFFVAKYDADGNVLWAKSAGGTRSDVGNGISTDANGNVWVTGYFNSTAITFGTITLTNDTTNDTPDVFVVKFDSNGNVLWAMAAGGNTFDMGYSITTDANGNVLVTGGFESSSITFGSSTMTNTFALYFDIFVVKYDASGNVLWTKLAGGTRSDFGHGISTDASGNIFVAGYFGSSTITFGTNTLTNVNYPFLDFFVVKYDASGNVLWAKSAGGANSDIGYGISTDANGNIFVTGYFQSSSITFGTTTLSNDTTNNTHDFFVVKYDPNGNVLWAQSAGGAKSDIGYDISTDASGNVLVAGYFNSTAITFGTITLTNDTTNNTPDVFVVKFDSAGNVLWAKSAGGAKSDIGNGISTDASGNIFVIGNFESSTIDFGSNTLSNVDISGNTTDIFVAKLNGTTGILENNFLNTMIIYPNPSSSKFTISGVESTSRIDIYNVFGQKIYEPPNLKNLLGNEIDLSNQPEGVYFISVSFNENTSSKKIVIMK